MYVLRKSYGAWSAGTEVEKIDDGGTDLFVLMYTSHVIPNDLVVQRRLRTTTRPFATTSRERRRNKKAALKKLGL